MVRKRAGSQRISNFAQQYRKILRELRVYNGPDIQGFIERARSIEEPYFAASALFAISKDHRIDTNSAESLVSEALGRLELVEAQWRYAELVSAFAKDVKHWRGKDRNAKSETIRNKIAGCVLAMPEGQGLSKAITGSALHLPESHYGHLLMKALGNKGFELGDAKAVIKAWLKSPSTGEPLLKEIPEIIKSSKDTALRSRLFGYLHHQQKIMKTQSQDLLFLKLAVESALKISGDERRDVLHYLATLSTTGEEIELIMDYLPLVVEPSERAGILTSLGGKADKAGLTNLAIKLFKDGFFETKSVSDLQVRARIRMNIAHGLALVGQREDSENIYRDSLIDCGDNNTLRNLLYKSIADDGFEALIPESVSNPNRSKKTKMNVQESETNQIFALYDTYEGGLSSIHFRSIARAVPLCIAFNLDLALMGFPTNDLKGLIERTGKESELGSALKYLNKLYDSGRIKLVQCSRTNPPGDWTDLGLPVATTSHPASDKNISLPDVITYAVTNHPAKRICIIMGLGRRGLPKSILDDVPYHLELTGKNIDLETCTAMGVIAQQLHYEIKKVNRKR